MKKLPIKHFLLILALGSMGFLSGCNGEDEETAPANKKGLYSYTTVLMGNQNSTEPNFYSTSENERYTLADAKTNAAAVDFGYGNGDVGGNEYFIGSPDDESIAFVYNDPTNGVATWSTLNSTRFKLTNLTTADYDTLTTTAGVIEAYANGTNPEFVSRVRGTEVEPNDVVAFQTEGGLTGVFRVVERTGTPNTDGSITINVKVERND